jgi:hypothetical protein
VGYEARNVVLKAFYENEKNGGLIKKNLNLRNRISSKRSGAKNVVLANCCENDTFHRNNSRSHDRNSASLLSACPIGLPAALAQGIQPNWQYLQ